MTNKVSNKKIQGKSTYNPALDKFEKIDVFPSKTAMVEDRFKDRDLVAEVEAALRKEKFMKP